MTALYFNKYGFLYSVYVITNNSCLNFNYTAVKAQNYTYTELSLSDMLSDSVRASELSDWSSLSCRDTGLYEE